MFTNHTIISILTDVLPDELSNQPAVYKITAGNYYYFGSSKRLRERISSHLNCFRLNDHKNQRLLEKVSSVSELTLHWALIPEEDLLTIEYNLIDSNLTDYYMVNYHASNQRVRVNGLPDEILTQAEYQKILFAEHPEYRNKMSESRKAYFANNPEANHRLSESLKDYYSNNPDVLIENRERQKQRFIDKPELRKEVSRRSLEVASRPGQREKMSAAGRKHYEDNPEARELTSQRTKQQFESQEARDKTAKSVKAYYDNNPEVKIEKLIKYSIPVIVEGVVYPNRKLAAEVLGISSVTVANRCRSDKHPEYRFSEEPCTRELIDEFNRRFKDMGKKIEVYTDGGTRPNPGNAGYGFSCSIPGHVVMGWGSIGTSKTNNAAELSGVLHALKELPNYIPEPTEINFNCDSQYTLGRLTNFPTPEAVQQAIDGNPQMPNGELIKEMITFRNKRMEEGYTFSYKHVFAHTGVVFNEIADMLATRGVADAMRYGKETQQLNILTDKEFKSPKDNRDKSKIPNLFSDALIFDWSRGFSEQGGQRRVHYIGSADLYSNKPKGKKNDDKTVRYMHYDGEYSKLRGVGGISAKDRYNVVFLKEPCEVLEKVREYQSDIIDNLYETQQFVVYRNDGIFNPRILELINNDQLHYLMPDNSDKGSLYSLTYPRINCSYVMNPPHLAFQIHELLQANALKLHNIVSGHPDRSGVTLTDVTSEVYDMEEKKGKLTYKVKPEWNGKDITLTVKHPTTKEDCKIFLVIGVDTPARNAFNKFIKQNPTIKIATWEYDADSFKFAVVCFTDEGELFWNCPYGSKQLERKARIKKK